MKYMDIYELIEKNYKEGDDWVYPQGKREEVKIIRGLLHLYQELRDHAIELEEKLTPIEKKA